ncbi:MAG: HEPN domain-containing protein [Candidatus Falkowbacteria bacterium]
MNLKDYFKQKIEAGHLKKEKIGHDQVVALIKAAIKNLSASEKNINIDEETCYAMAYNAMLKIGRAIIYLSGMRPDDGQQHKTTVEAAGRILGDDFNDLIVNFDKMRRKRNQFTYDPIAPLGREEAIQALGTAKKFITEVKKYLDKTNPQRKLF